MVNNRTPIIVNGEQEMMLSVEEIIQAIKHNIWEYKVYFGKSPDTIAVTIPVYTAIKAYFSGLIVERNIEGNVKALLMGIPLEVIDNSDAFFMVGEVHNCKVRGEC